MPILWIWVWIALHMPGLRAAELLSPGFRPEPRGLHALTGARVVTKPGHSHSNGVVVIKDGLIAAAGDAEEADIPEGARIWDMQGHVIYPGLIDPHVEWQGGGELPRTSSGQPNARHADAGSSGAIRFYGVAGEEMDPGAPGPGSELAVVRPQFRVADRLAVSESFRESFWKLGITAINLVPQEGILRGSSALMNLGEVNPNAAILNADVAQYIALDRSASPGRAYPGSLMGVLASIRQSFFNAAHYREDWEHYEEHADRRARPMFNPAWAALDPALQRRQAVVFDPRSVLMVHRAAALGNELGLRYHLLASGEEWRRPDLMESIDASFIVPLNFPEVPKMPEESDWIQVSLDQLRAWDWAPENAALLRRMRKAMAVTTHGLGDKKKFRKNIQLALNRGLSEQDALAALTTVPAEICGVSDRLGTLEPGKIANLTVVQGTSYFNPEDRVAQVWIDGRVYRVNPGEKEKEAQDGEGERSDEDDSEPTAEQPKPSLAEARVAKDPLNGRGPLAEPEYVLVRGATIWTCGPDGILAPGDLLVRNGRVEKVGTNLDRPSADTDQLREIDGTGLHVTPGLIDAHSHSMILGGVNESTLPSSAMVRIADVVNSETANLRRQLAGGLTVANLLHGSANPIGGQNAVIKLKDGASPDELIFAEAPGGIKFALGENVKQSNWGDDNRTRFPQTRMGVPTFMENRFTAAQQYLESIENRRDEDPPVARNLELEALGEILRGQRWIHCHSYRQDEILAFLRAMEKFGIQVGTLQHVLEGYKVADEIARHGAGGSCFSDWWAYKYEVIDAIPYAGSLMHERGVLVSFNSDSSDQARRMNTEAAKAVKYGGTSEEEALHFVTINPARQLRIAERVGSLEPGKDADFALWSGSPLDTRSVCLQTWIEGKLYYDRDREAERAQTLAEERRALLAKARKKKESSNKEQNTEDAEADVAAQARFFRVCLEHRYDHVDRHCLDHE